MLADDLLGLGIGPDPALLPKSKTAQTLAANDLGGLGGLGGSMQPQSPQLGTAAALGYNFVAHNIAVAHNI